MPNIDTYKEILIKNGFKEALDKNYSPFHFWKRLTDKTAFVVNLKDLENKVGVVYGVISTAVFWTDDEWEFFKLIGSSDEDCNLRFYVEIHSDEDEISAKKSIEKLYQEYLYIDKDTLLSNVKQRRKEFIKLITDFFKPLGFRKKGNQWRKQLSENITLQFWADKDPYSDLYYFEVDVFSINPPGGLWCYDIRLDTQGTEIFDWKKASQPNTRFDWQLQSTDDLLEIIKYAYEKELKPFLENELSEMGKQPYIWDACMCQRKHCPNCWIEKNYWEARGIER